jgi:hypothetical protein
MGAGRGGNADRGPNLVGEKAFLGRLGRLGVARRFIVPRRFVGPDPPRLLWGKEHEGMPGTWRRGRGGRVRMLGTHGRSSALY